MHKWGLTEPETIENISPLQEGNEDNNRRSFLKKATLGGITLGGAFLFAPIEDVVARSTSGVKRFSSPSDLKITDMRYCVVQNVGRTPIIRIDTNQGIYGLGEVRDGADERYALMLLKSRILGQNPAMLKCSLKQSNNLAGKAGRAAVYAPLKWRYGISVAKHIMCLHGNCSVAGTAIK